MPALIAVNGPAAGVRFEFEGEAVIGRSPACEIALYDGKVSRRHARLRVDGARVFLLDLESRNGTLVNGSKVEREVALAPGDRIQTGEIQFVYEPHVAAAHPSREGAIDAAPASAAVLGAEQVPVLVAATKSLLSAASPAAVLRRGLEEATRSLKADRGAAILPGGPDRPPEVAATLGGPIAQHRELVRAALERGEAAIAGEVIAAPLGGVPALGALVLERDRVFTVPERDLLAHLGRIAGEALAAARGRAPQPTPSQIDVIVGANRALRRALELARRAASSVHPVLLRGERGVGKALVARYLHERGPRREGPFVEIDCRLPREELSEVLFGREPDRPGALERADGGTVYLAEVSCLGAELGEGVARALAARAVARLESERLRPADFQIVAATAEELDARARAGGFDPDLLRRLSAQAVEVPPLRDRRSDVPLLAAHFAERCARALRREPPSFSAEALRKLEAHGWSGNVRELRNVIERLVHVAPAGAEIGPEALPREVRGLSLGPEARLAELVAQLERDAIAEALRRARGKKIKAAALLGISRPTLDKKILDYKLEVPRK